MTSLPLPKHTHTADVIVAGAGPSGIAAAIASASAGADTVLIEQCGTAGGQWTAGALGWMLDYKDGRITDLLRERLHAMGTGTMAPMTGRAFSFHPEAMKIVLDDVLAECGVRTRLYTTVAAVETDPDTLRVMSLTTVSKSGVEQWRASCFVDATGDGDVAAMAGCGFDIGDPQHGGCQPMSLLAVIAGLRFEEIEDYVSGYAPHAGVKARLRDLLRAQGVEPSYLSVSLFRLDDGLFVLMGNHVYGHSGLDADALTRAVQTARKEVFAQVAALRRAGGPWRHATVAATAESLGVRETRRIHGLYTVTREDLLTGQKHDDGICRCEFPIDIHALTPEESPDGIRREGGKVLPYDIPLRSLIARDRRHLVMAGRCISGDFYAHSSYRVMGNAVPTGDAAGVLAAGSASTGRTPAEVDFRTVLEQLRQPLASS